MELSRGPLTATQIAANSKRLLLAGLFVVRGSRDEKAEGAEWRYFVGLAIGDSKGKENLYITEKSI
jgi:hypothetical protein